MNNDEKYTALAELRNDIVGIDSIVPLLDGTERRYVFLDNAASTPTFGRVMKCIEDFMPWYSGVHRGTGIKSLVATDIFDEAHEIIGNFVGADLATNVVILGKNTTEVVNKLANRINLTKYDIVISTLMEHHSNDLPWRQHAKVIHIGIDENGFLLIDELKEALKKYSGHIKLVAVSGASNVTGICNPIHQIARWTHEAGGKIFIDAAQLAPHRAIDMKPDDDPEHLDFIAFSAHKMYAPFGTGVLIGPREVFEEGDPDIVGGGVVELVTPDRIMWNQPPHKEEAGSPNVVGAVALAKAILILQEVGMDVIAKHEAELLAYAFEKLRKVPKIRIFGPTEDLSSKVGVMSFNVLGMRHALVGAIFGMEGAIGLRNGCFCAHTYLKYLLSCPVGKDTEFLEQIEADDRSQLPGMVRASLGCYSNEEDVDLFIEMLYRIVKGEYRGEYVQDTVSGAFTPVGYHFNASKFFSLHRQTIPEKGDYVSYSE